MRQGDRVTPIPRIKMKLTAEYVDGTTLTRAYLEISLSFRQMLNNKGREELYALRMYEADTSGKITKRYTPIITPLGECRAMFNLMCKNYEEKGWK